jgi:hypothetical protein
MDRSKVNNDHSDPDSSFKERYGVQLNVETIFMYASYPITLDRSCGSR